MTAAFPASNLQSRTIMLVDDDPDDQLLVREALVQAGWTGHVQYALDGQELVTMLERATSGDPGVHLPDLILLDLKMPRLDGHEAIRIVRSQSRWRFVRIVVLTTSSNPEDIRKAYASGGDAYLIKPLSFDGLVEMISSVVRYWFGTVTLP